MEPLWNKMVARKGKRASFIGCGKIDPLLPGDNPTFIAVVRRDHGEVVGINPWILKFAESMVSFDSLSVDAGSMWYQKPILSLRGADAVGMIMPMRFTGSDMKSYDLDGPAMSLSGGIHAVSEKLG